MPRRARTGRQKDRRHRLTPNLQPRPKTGRLRLQLRPRLRTKPYRSTSNRKPRQPTLTARLRPICRTPVGRPRRRSPWQQRQPLRLRQQAKNHRRLLLRTDPYRPASNRKPRQPALTARLRPTCRAPAGRSRRRSPRQRRQPPRLRQQAKSHRRLLPQTDPYRLAQNRRPHRPILATMLQPTCRTTAGRPRQCFPRQQQQPLRLRQKAKRPRRLLPRPAPCRPASNPEPHRPTLSAMPRPTCRAPASRPGQRSSRQRRPRLRQQAKRRSCLSAKHCPMPPIISQISRHIDQLPRRCPPKTGRKSSWQNPSPWPPSRLRHRMSRPALRPGRPSSQLFPSHRLLRSSPKRRSRQRRRSSRAHRPRHPALPIHRSKPHLHRLPSS